MNDTKGSTALDPRPVDNRHALPNDVTQRSSQSAELSVIAGLGFDKGETA